MTVYMCSRCGSTRWYEDFYTSGTSRHYSSLEEGEDYETENQDDNEETGDSGDSYCTECGSSDLLAIDDLSGDEVECLRDMPSKEARDSAYDKMVDGEPIEPKAPRKGKLIGGRPIQ